MSVHIYRLAPAHMRGSYFGAANLYSLGFASAPILGGLMLDHWGGPALYKTCFVLALLVLLLYYLTKYLKRPNFSNLPSTQAASQKLELSDQYWLADTNFSHQSL